MLTVGSLFAGIGGFDLGFERAGMRTLWQVEQSEFCRRVLERHFPDAKRYGDVRSVVGRPSSHGNSLEPVDLICGGFPCQDLSYAGKGAGIDGERSGLWSEYARIVGELRPRYVVVENVPALLGRGLGRVLGDLATLGYDAEWDCLPASAFGAPHRRDRIWLVAYPDGSGRVEGQPRLQAREPDAEGCSAVVGDPEGNGRGTRRPGRPDPTGAGQREPERSLQGADPDRGRLQECSERDSGTIGPGLAAPQRRHADGLREAVADSDGEVRSATRSSGEEIPRPEAVERPGRCGGGEGSPWAVEPDVGRVANGVPSRVDRLAALGNALVPQIAEWIGRRIVEWEEGEVAA